MNILFLLHSYPKIGGIEMVTETVSRYLVKKHNVFYLARICDKNLSDKYKNCFYFPVRNGKGAIDYYNNLVERLNIDIVINQGPFLPYNSILNNKWRNKNVRIYSFLHFMPGFDFERIKTEWHSEKNPLKRQFKRIKTMLHLNSVQYNPEKIRKKYRLLCEYSNKVILLSDSYIDLFAKAYHQKDTSMLMSIPNPSKYECERHDILDIKKKTVLFVGRLEYESKRVDRLINIWNRITDKNGWTLKIVGDGPDREFLQQFASENNVSEIEFIGQKNDIRPYYEEASVVVLTSEFEGLSLCFIEAMQFGAIPLCFDVSLGNHEMIEEVSDLLLVPPFDMDKFVSVLSGLMKDDSMRMSLARKSLECGKKYLLDNIGKQWDALIES